jgi:hypothetical protein
MHFRILVSRTFSSIVEKVMQISLFCLCKAHTLGLFFGTKLLDEDEVYSSLHQFKVYDTRIMETINVLFSRSKIDQEVALQFRRLRQVLFCLLYDLWNSVLST